jgi:hypothetical protein
VPEKRTKVAFPGAPGGMADGSEVSISESTERWSEIHLEDGSVLRVKPNVLAAVRVDSQFDQDGNPVYALKTGLTMTVASAPEHLRKGGKGRVQ